MPLTKIQSLGITDGTIVNADINASAAITLAKLSGVNDAKVWVNFNGTGTVAIRTSFNVTSITDNGTGNYTVNFTTAMPDANYAFALAVSFANALVTTVYQDTGTAPTSSSLTFYVANTSNNAATDVTQICVIIFR
jgi:hypothetical protein